LVNDGAAAASLLDPTGTGDATGADCGCLGVCGFGGVWGFVGGGGSPKPGGKIDSGPCCPNCWPTTGNATPMAATPAVTKISEDRCFNRIVDLITFALLRCLCLATLQPEFQPNVVAAHFPAIQRKIALQR
jgi:hypothetical protein